MPLWGVVVKRMCFPILIVCVVGLLNDVLGLVNSLFVLLKQLVRINVIADNRKVYQNAPPPLNCIGGWVGVGGGRWGRRHGRRASQPPAREKCVGKQRPKNGPIVKGVLAE